MEKKRKLMEKILKIGEDGVIMQNDIGKNEEDIKIEEENGMKVVIIERSVEGVNDKVLRGENEYGIGIEKKNMIQIGNKRIEMIGGKEKN